MKMANRNSRHEFRHGFYVFGELCKLLLWKKLAHLIWGAKQFFVLKMRWELFEFSTRSYVSGETRFVCTAQKSCLVSCVDSCVVGSHMIWAPSSFVVVKMRWELFKFSTRSYVSGETRIFCMVRNCELC